MFWFNEFFPVEYFENKIYQCVIVVIHVFRIDFFFQNISTRKTQIIFDRLMTDFMGKLQKYKRIYTWKNCKNPIWGFLKLLNDSKGK